MLIVDSIKILNKIKNHEPGEKALVNENGRVYEYNGDAWEYSKDNDKSSISLYALNKGAVGQLPPLSEEELENKKLELNDFIEKSNNNFFMLLSNEKHYYTLFNRTSTTGLKPMSEEVLSILKDLGEIKVISVEDNKVEIWINDYILLLFPYDLGVIECN